MTEDLSSKLKKIKAAKEAKRETDRDTYTSFIKGWNKLVEDILDPSLEETEQTFLLEDGPPVFFKKEGEDRVLQVEKDERRCHRLRFHPYWPECRVIIETTSPNRYRHEDKYKLEDLSKAAVDEYISRFMEKAL